MLVISIPLTSILWASRKGLITELTALFGEDVCRLTIEEEKNRSIIRGFHEGMTLAIYTGESCGKMVEVAGSGKDRKLSLGA